MPTLHITQGGIENGDKRWLEKADRTNRKSVAWTIPKTANVGDDVVVFIGGYGFYATGVVHSAPLPRPDWANRYGAAIASIRLIDPAISLASIQRHVPRLTWANYPRSITTPPPEVADTIRK